MLKIIINGQTYEVPDGITVLQAANLVGITIPTLCDHPDLSPYGGCRLCNVEVKGARLPLSSCTLQVSDGMEIQTETADLIESRIGILELLLSNYYDAGYSIGDESQNELTYWAQYYGIDISKHSLKEPRCEVDTDPNPFIWVDFNKCILCTRCIRACSEIQGRFVWGLAERGFNSQIEAGVGTTLFDARCESCGTCVSYCPTGALNYKMSIHAEPPDKIVTTTCTFCGVGCQLNLNVKDNRIIRVTSNPESPVNGNHLCVKGHFGYDFVHHPDRLTQPTVREYLLKNMERSPKSDRGNWITVDWDKALDIVSQKLSDRRDIYGPDSIGMLTSAKCTNEENYLMNKFARQVIGTNNIDHCARLCHSSTVAGLATTLGSGAMTNSMDDIVNASKAMLIIGSNTTEQHPVFGAMIRQAVQKRNVKLVVADPRKIDITEFAILHLQHEPGTDIALLNGIMYIILEREWENKAFIEDRTEGFEGFKENLKHYPPDKVEEITGVTVEKLYLASEILATNSPMAVMWAMGITQHTVGVQNVITCANLQMLLGNMGIPGGGVNPLRGQNNVQGACDLGGLPNVYPGYQKVTDKHAQSKFEKAWGVPLSNKVGQTITDLTNAAEKGTVKALYILGENPVMSDPDSNHVRHCLEELDFMVLQEIFPSETAAYADVLLPGVSFAEKTGTFTNTERRIQMVRKAIEPSGEAKPDWMITSELARRILQKGKQKTNAGNYASWNYQNTSEIMEEIAALTPIYAGVSHNRLEAGDRLQWPIKGFEHLGTPILHVGKFARGKGKMIPTDHIPPAEQPDDDYPFLLSTGRVLYHWHGGEMTRRAKGLLEAYNQSLIELNPEDAERIGVNPVYRIRVTSRRGFIEAKAWITDRVPPGMIYANFHFPEAPANYLTIAALDPIAKIPEYKVCAVKVEVIRS